MEKQIVEISNDNYYLSLHRGFLRVKNKNNENYRDVPLDNIMSLILSSNDVVISKNIVNEVCANGGSVIFCDKSYIPHVVALSCSGHWLMSDRIKKQISASIPLQKNLWKSIVQNKISNQARVLETFYPQHPNISRLKRLSKETLSNDIKNNEGQAANIYFKSLFGEDFIRDRKVDNINVLLNYIYTVLRAMVLRAIIGNGLLPYLGIKHCNKSNQFPLADDLMEPFRAVADKIVFNELKNMKPHNEIELSSEMKKKLTSIISYPVEIEKGKVSLNEGIYSFVASLVSCYDKKNIHLKYPKI